MTPRQQQFVREYLIDLNATQAAIRAGYSARSAEVQGARLLGEAKIAAAIKAAQEKRARKTEVDAARVVQEYARIAFADIKNAVAWGSNTVTLKASDDLPADVTAAISEVRETKDGVQIKFHSKTAALDSLARHLGMFKDVLKLDVPNLQAWPQFQALQLALASALTGHPEARAAVCDVLAQMTRTDEGSDH